MLRIVSPYALLTVIAKLRLTGKLFSFEPERKGNISCMADIKEV